MHVLGQSLAFVQNRLIHLGEYLILDAKFNFLEVGNLLKFLTIIGLPDIL